ncbi:uncharacterized protein LOC117101874 [Anneissia japonica]|uniref:uncharacterized protein LOC117101874 n=1 Tax=Anneissia japonica TaxID=1529436 RepID=UPI00142597F5|nr:uncharacterized protein LOC117101874 [Anneissia japonica]
MEGRVFMFSVVATFCFLSIIIEASRQREATYNGTGCDVDRCCPMGIIYTTFAHNGDMQKCCKQICPKSKRGNNVPEQRFIQDELLENGMAILRFLLHKKKYKADFEQYLEQS